MCRHSDSPSVLRRVNARWALIAGILLWAAAVEESAAAIPQTERAALIALYDATGGLNWVRSDNWLGPDGSECGWFGVTCDETQSHVTELALGYNGLGGQLPALAPLTWLKVLALGNNQISGPIPDMSTLGDLEVILLSGNHLEGPIPPLDPFPNLYLFAVSENLLVGSIPDLSTLSGLYTFSVDHNQLTGALPSLDGLAALTYFDVNDNQLSGPPPDPSTTNLGHGGLCPNNLDPIESPAWDAITGTTPWYYWCVTPTVPIILWDPTSFAAVAAPEQQATATLHITNNGGIPLHWSVIASEDHCAGGTIFQWLHLDRQSGTSAPGASESVYLTFDTAEVTEGTYSGSLCVVNDDAVQGTVEIAVQFEVSSDAGNDPIFADGFDD